MEKKKQIKKAIQSMTSADLFAASDLLRFQLRSVAFVEVLEVFRDPGSTVMLASAVAAVQRDPSPTVSLADSSLQDWAQRQQMEGAVML